jgi:hypothetical protein
VSKKRLSSATEIEASQIEKTAFSSTRKIGYLRGLLIATLLFIYKSIYLSTMNQIKNEKNEDLSYSERRIEKEVTREMLRQTVLRIEEVREDLTSNLENGTRLNLRQFYELIGYLKQESELLKESGEVIFQ